jgi:hypothetical protein
MQQELLQEAVETFGKQIVDETISIVEQSDSDGAWSMFSDMGMEEHAECIELLYFG